MASNNEDKKAAPPARVTKQNKERALEMMAMVKALPPSKEKEALMKSEQYAEWKYYADTCQVKKYTKRLTQEERRNGVVVQDGVEIKMWKKGTWCFHCNCSAQEFKRHLKSAKHQACVKKPFASKLCGNIKVAAEMKNKKLNIVDGVFTDPRPPFVLDDREQGIHRGVDTTDREWCGAGASRRPPPAYVEPPIAVPVDAIRGEPADEEQNQAFHLAAAVNTTPIIAVPCDLPHHSEMPPPPPPAAKKKKTKRLKIIKKIKVVEEDGYPNGGKYTM